MRSAVPVGIGLAGSGRRSVRIRSMTLVVAHRGASADAPENTVAAFRLARTLGADWVELDVRLTADGATAVIHDPCLADGRSVSQLRRSELPASVPTLAAALEACAGMGVNVELKNERGGNRIKPSRFARLLGEELVSSGFAGPVLVSSFDPVTIEAVRAAHPALPTGFLYAVPLPADDLISTVVAAGHQAIHPQHSIVDAALVTAAHAAGIAVNVWTVDDAVRMGELLDLGVDALITNTVAGARSVVASRQR
jgi:glycerophosphoryl diester phosphodiesterase